MNWLRSYVRPKIRRLVTPRELPDHLWDKCPGCEAMIFRRQLDECLYVCPHCDFHMRLGPHQRASMLFDQGQYQLVDLPKSPADPLKFRDQKRYVDRVKAAQEKTGHPEAIIIVRGLIGQIKTVVVIFDFQFMGGSMGIAVGEGLLSAARLAILQDVPLIVIPASGGARMQEGILSLMQLPRTVLAIEQVKEAGLPYLVVLTDPTTGGVTASFAMLGDIQIAEKGALVGFAGARVIESTVREILPEGFQRSESLLEYGMVDMVVHRRELRDVLIKLLDLLVRRIPGKSGEDAPRLFYEAPSSLLPPNPES